MIGHQKPPQGAHPRHRWRLAALFFTLYLTVQVAVPVHQLFAPRPARFGWHMYSIPHDQPAIEAILENGSTRPVVPSLLLGKVAPEMEPQLLLVPFLCRGHSPPRAFRLSYPRSKRSEVVPCP